MDLGNLKDLFKDFIQDSFDDAFNNSYLLVTGQRTYPEMLAESIKKNELLILVYDPGDPIEPKEIKLLIDYFVEQEEYEKCSELKKLLEINK